MNLGIEQKKYIFSKMLSWGIIKIGKNVRDYTYKNTYYGKETSSESEMFDLNSYKS